MKRTLLPLALVALSCAAPLACAKAVDEEGLPSILDSGSTGGDTNGDETIDVDNDTGVPDDTSIDDTGTVDDTGTIDDTGAPPDDTGSLDDTGLADTGTIVDSGPADTGTIVDSGPADTGSTSDTGGGCAPTDFGISEIMVRALAGGSAGTADHQEWVEFTNFGSCTLSIAGFQVKVITVSSSSTTKATFTFPAGTSVKSGEAIVIAGDKASFVADVSGSYGLGQVFDFGGLSDIMSNSATIEVQITASGASTYYERIDIPTHSSSWPVGRSYGYPTPVTATCPASGRINASNAPTATWKDTAASAGNSYGSDSTASTTLYGSPTKSNTAIACP